MRGLDDEAPAGETRTGDAPSARDYAFHERTIGTILADKSATVGDRPFLLFDGEHVTYSRAHDLTRSHATGFARAGIGRGDHVALMLPNTPELLWAVWGLGLLGAVAVPLNTAARGDLLTYLLDQSDSVLLVADDAYRDRADAAVAAVPAVRTVLGADALRGFADLPPYEPGPDAPPVRPSDPHLIMYTSGTTGPSKGVVCPHSQGHAVGRQMAVVNRYTADDVLYTCLPLFHANALWFTVYAALWADACVALFPAFSARRFWDEIRSSGATVFNALGAMANIIWQLPESGRDREHRVRQAMVVPTSRRLVDGFAQRYGIRVTSVFAMTENCAVTVLGPDDPPDKAASAGLVRPQVAVRIVDEAEQPLPPGEVGEIVLRPDEPGSIMLGYYRMPEATVAATRDLWFHTGDRGRLDADGYLFFVDRTKESIRRRGENISAYEVETAICRHPGIREAAAVPVPSELGEDDVMVWLVREPGVEPVSYADLVGYCAGQMAYYMVPRYLEEIDALPKTPSEKIEKYKLAVAARERLEQLWDREKAGIEVRR